jgi:hypothetical protein
MTCVYRKNGESLAELAVSVDLGVMVSVESADADGLEWKSSDRGSFKMNWNSMTSLLDDWDGQEGVLWFFDGFFIEDGHKQSRRSAVRVPAAMMMEIRVMKLLVEAQCG